MHFKERWSILPSVIFELYMERDVMAAIVVSTNSETAAMLVSQANPAASF